MGSEWNMLPAKTATTMKPIHRDELYQNLSGFLKSRGIELKDGSYAQGIQRTCSVLADAINLGQKGLGRAKAEIGKKLDQVRQVVHEKTAPASPARAAAQTSARKPPGAKSKRPKTRKRSS
jgi:hypothetical protein